MSLYELVTLKSGLKSLRRRDNQETFHPVIGPLAEARILHVEQQRLAERCAPAGRFSIWDVGLGAAANAVAAIEALQRCDAEVTLHSFDHTTEPLEFALLHAEALGYVAPHQETLRELLSVGEVRVSNRLKWVLHRGDFCERVKRVTEGEAPQAIFYDPYSPVSNPEMWTLEHFELLRRSLDDSLPCLITNYTRSTVVRVTWLLAGFYVGKGVGIGEKGETTVASNDLRLLESPLSQSWLDRVRTSGSARPLRIGEQTAGPISVSDLERLRALPQLSESLA